jgi:hypothetical protein
MRLAALSPAASHPRLHPFFSPTFGLSSTADFRFHPPAAPLLLSVHHSRPLSRLSFAPFNLHKARVRRKAASF